MVFRGHLPAVQRGRGRRRTLRQHGRPIGQQVPAVGFSIGFERVCGILLEQGYQILGAKPKMALLYLKDADFAAVLAKAELTPTTTGLCCPRRRRQAVRHAGGRGLQCRCSRRQRRREAAWAESRIIAVKTLRMCRKYGTSHFFVFALNTGAFSVLYW